MPANPPDTEALNKVGAYARRPAGCLGRNSQLETLHLYSSSPVGFVDEPFILEPRRTVTLHHFAQFRITPSAEGCALALAHIVSSAFTSLHVSAESQDKPADEVRHMLLEMSMGHRTRHHFRAYYTDTEVFDALLTPLFLNAISTLSAQSSTRLSEGV